MINKSQDKNKIKFPIEMSQVQLTMCAHVVQ